MTPENNAKLGKLTGGFPFLMLIASIFFQGFTFLLLNGPTIYAIVTKHEIDEKYVLFIQRVFFLWGDFVKIVNGSISVWLLVLISLALGFMLTPLMRVSYAFSILIATKILKSKKDYYNPHNLIDEKKYVRTLAWLFGNPTAKLNWEWHLFQVYIYWAAFANFLLFSLFSLLYGWSITCAGISMKIGEIALYSIILYIYGRFVFYHIRFMHKVHDFYNQYT